MTTINIRTSGEESLAVEQARAVAAVSDGWNVEVLGNGLVLTVPASGRGRDADQHNAQVDAELAGYPGLAHMIGMALLGVAGRRQSLGPE